MMVNTFLLTIAMFLQMVTGKLMVITLLYGGGHCPVRV